MCDMNTPSRFYFKYPSQYGHVTLYGHLTLHDISDCLLRYFDSSCMNLHELFWSSFSKNGPYSCFLISCLKTRFWGIMAAF